MLIRGPPLGLQNEESLATDSDEFPLDRVHDRFQAIVSSQLLVDVMEVIAEGLRADAENAGHFIHRGFCQHENRVDFPAAGYRRGGEFYVPVGPSTL